MWQLDIRASNTHRGFSASLYMCVFLQSPAWKWSSEDQEPASPQNSFITQTHIYSIRSRNRLISEYTPGPCPGEEQSKIYSKTAGRCLCWWWTYREWPGESAQWLSAQCWPQGQICPSGFDTKHKANRDNTGHSSSAGLKVEDTNKLEKHV